MVLHLVSTKWGLQLEQWLLCKHENAPDPHKSWVWEGKGSRSGAHGSALIPWELWETLCDGPLTYCSDFHMYTSCVHTCLHIIYTQWKEVKSSQTDTQELSRHKNWKGSRHGSIHCHTSSFSPSVSGSCHGPSGPSALLSSRQILR